MASNNMSEEHNIDNEELISKIVLGEISGRIKQFTLMIR